MAEQDLQIQIDELKRKVEDLTRFKLHNHSGLNSDPMQLEFIDNVTIEAIASGEIIVFDGGGYVNQTLTEAGIQAQDDGLDDIAALAVTNSNFIVGDGSNWVAESGVTARTSLGAAASGANADITSMTGLTGAIGNPVEIKGDGGLPTLRLGDNGASASSSLKIWNAESANKVLVTGEGNTNVAIMIKGKGSGQVHLGDDELLFPDSDGSANQYIKTDGSGTLAFATPPATQAWELIETKTLGSDANSVTFSSISTDYIAFRLTIIAWSSNSGSNGRINMQFNSDTGSNYSYTGTATANIIQLVSGTTNNARRVLIDALIQNLDASSDKSVMWKNVSMPPSVGTVPSSDDRVGYWDNNAKITTIKIFAAVGGTNLKTGSKFILEGTKE